jgi:hypothetical protein
MLFLSIFFTREYLISEKLEVNGLLVKKILIFVLIWQRFCQPWGKRKESYKTNKNRGWKMNGKSSMLIIFMPDTGFCQL